MTEEAARKHDSFSSKFHRFASQEAQIAQFVCKEETRSVFQEQQSCHSVSRSALEISRSVFEVSRSALEVSRSALEERSSIA